MGVVAVATNHFWLCDVPGNVTLRDDGPLSLADLYDQLVADGLLDTFFYDCHMGKLDFIHRLRRDDQWVYAAFSMEGDPLVFSILNNHTGYSALSHFCYFRAGMDMRETLAYEWLRTLRDGGMRSLVGLTPKPYRHAWRFAINVGYKMAGIVPGACILAHHNNRVCDGVLTICNLQEV